MPLTGVAWHDRTSDIRSLTSSETSASLRDPKLSLATVSTDFSNTLGFQLSLRRQVPAEKGCRCNELQYLCVLSFQRLWRLRSELSTPSRSRGYRSCAD